jgi:hypothetical protein
MRNCTQKYRVVSKAVQRLNIEENVADKGGVVWYHPTRA